MRGPEGSPAAETLATFLQTWQYDIHPDLPLGPPQLMMSYTDPSQLPEKFVTERDAKYGISTAAKAESRAGYLDGDFEPDEQADQSVRTGKVRIRSLFSVVPRAL